MCFFNNLFFDVPVKLGAANVLILAIAVVSPDLCTLWKLFVLHIPARVDSRWAPGSERRTLRMAIRASEILFVVFAIIQFFPAFEGAYAQLQANLQNPSPLVGEWHVASVLRKESGVQTSLPVLTGMGQPMTDITFEPSGMVMARATDGMLWRAQARIDLAKRTLTLGSAYLDGERFAATYKMTHLDAKQLILEPVGDVATINGTMTLSRVPLPTHYPLLERKFHWVNEWALER